MVLTPDPWIHHSQYPRANRPQTVITNPRRGLSDNREDRGRGRGEHRGVQGSERVNATGVKRELSECFVGRVFKSKRKILRAL